MTSPALSIRCLSCGYDVASLIAQRGREEPGICPECGSLIRNTLAKQVGWLPRCLRCGHNLTSLAQESPTRTVAQCPTCASSTDEAFRQAAALRVYDRLTLATWLDSVWLSVRHPNVFLLRVNPKRTRTIGLTILNTVAAVLLLGGAPTLVMSLTIEWDRFPYRIVAEEFEAPLGLAFIFGCFAVGSAVIGGAAWTVLVVRNVGHPTNAHVISIGFFFASCWALALSLLVLPFGLALGFYPPPWSEPPDFIAAVWAISVLLLPVVTLGATCYGVWKMRYLNPARRPASAPATTPCRA